MSKLIVKVDPDLRDLIPGFIARKHQDVDAIRNATNSADYTGLSSSGHKIKGEGGSYGLDEISAIGEALEAAAQRHDAAACLALADRLADYLNTVEVVFD